MNLTAMLDTESLAELTRLQGFSSLLSPEITNALTQAGTLLVDAAQANTWNAFKNPSGALASAISFYVASPEEVQIIVGVPYAHRLEMGFNGTDSLGRHYNNPPEPYLLPAVEDNEEAVQALITQAVDNAIGRVTL